MSAVSCVERCAGRLRRPCIELLGPVRDERRAAGADQRAAASATAGVGEHVAVEVGDVGVGRRPRGPRSAAPGRAVPAGVERDAPVAGGERLEPLRGAGRGRAGRRRRPRAGAASGSVAASPSASRRRGQSVRNSSWLKSTRAGSRSNGHRARGRSASNADLDVAAQHRHLAVHARPGPRISSRFWRCLGGSSSRCSKIPSSGPVRRDELRRGLLPDPGHAGQVVARVAAQGRVLGVLRRA